MHKKTYIKNLTSFKEVYDHTAVRGKIGFAGFTTANAAANWIVLRVTGAAA